MLTMAFLMLLKPTFAEAQVRKIPWYCRFYIALGISIAGTACEQKTSPPPPPPAVGQTQPAAQIDKVAICTFNIQFLGSRKLRDNKALARLLADHDCDVVTVQELVAPPDFRVLKASPYYGHAEMPFYPGTEKRLQPTEVAHDFFVQMEAVGYDGFIMSPDKTGPNVRDTSNSTAAEWFVAFYRSRVVEPAFDLPNGFLDENLFQNPNYQRVPYAFAFRTQDGRFDFVLISVHLNPGGGSKDQKRRAEEFTAMFEWIKKQKENGRERDYIILGDTNIENAAETAALEELAKNMGVDMKTLNIGANYMTNTNQRGGSQRPYDHVFIHLEDTAEVAYESNFDVIDLIEQMRSVWDGPEDTYPGDPYNHTLFIQYYSDHHPVRVWAQPPDRDDD